MEVTEPEFDLRSIQLLIKDPGVMSSPAKLPAVNFIFSGWKARDIWPWVEDLIRSLGLRLHLRMDIDVCANKLEDLQYVASSGCVDRITSDQERRVDHLTFLFWLRESFSRESQTVVQAAFPGLKSITVFYSGSIDMRLRASLEIRYESTGGPNNVVIERPPDLTLNFRTIFGKPDYENARLFVGMGGIKEVVVNGVGL
ncbi:hypothetical protein FRC01_002404 [Tulasnella sp. 417]|nr:hypothetical protein FRC01_002404 [Tulasnella sp. 417]